MNPHPSEDSRHPDIAGGDAALLWAESRGLGAWVRAETESRVRRRRRRVSILSGGLAILLLAGGATWRGTFHRGETQLPSASATPSLPSFVSAPLRQTLPDGSVAELKDGAQIEVHFSATFRRISLVRGEAYFEVAKNPRRPFVVSAGGLEVRAVGTQFAVGLPPSAVEVLVTEGRVAVDRSADPAHRSSPAPSAGPLVSLSAGDRVVAEIGHASLPPLAVQALSAAEIAERLSWRIPLVRLSGTPTSEVVPVFSRYGHFPIVLADPAVGRIRLSGTLRADNTSSLVRVLMLQYGVRATCQSDGAIVLSLP